MSDKAKWFTVDFGTALELVAEAEKDMANGTRINLENTVLVYLRDYVIGVAEDMVELAKSQEPEYIEAAQRALLISLRRDVEKSRVGRDEKTK